MLLVNLQSWFTETMVNVGLLPAKTHVGIIRVSGQNSSMFQKNPILPMVMLEPKIFWIFACWKTCSLWWFAVFCCRVLLLIGLNHGCVLSRCSKIFQHRCNICIMLSHISAINTSSKVIRSLSVLVSLFVSLLVGICKNQFSQKEIVRFWC